MRSLLRLGVAMLCTAIAAPAFAGFGVATTDLGTINGTFTVNQLVSDGSGLALKTEGTSTIIESDPSTYSTTETGSFKLFRVDVNSIADGTFEHTFDQQVLAIVASNSLSLHGMGLSLDVLATFEAEIASQVSLTSTLGGNHINAVEILAFNTNNPDIVTINGNVVSGDVTKIATAQSAGESFYVLTAVPEPASLAVWGTCSLGCLVAARRRKRKQCA